MAEHIRGGIYMKVFTTLCKYWLTDPLSMNRVKWVRGYGRNYARENKESEGYIIGGGGEAAVERE